MKQSKYLSGYLFVMILALQSCSLNQFANSIKGNEDIIQEEISISDYSAIELSVSGKVVYQQIQGGSPYLQIKVDENILPLLDITVKDNCLRIRTEDNESINPSLLVITTNSRNLNRINLSGSGTIHLMGDVNTNNMNASISGSGDIISDNLHCESIDLKVTGSGDATLNGTGKSARFSVTGSGDIHAHNYPVQEGNCQVTGSGDIYAHATEKLKASVTGSGDIKYKGNPQTDSKITGSGDIKQVR